MKTSIIQTDAQNLSETGTFCYPSDTANSQLFVIPRKEMPANLAGHLSKELNQIITLCNEAIALLGEGEVTNRVSDILADEIPAKSEALFDVIFNWRNSSVRNINNTTKDKIV